jgi:hypothetical protein
VDIIGGFAACRWPGGQSRVSNAARTKQHLLRPTRRIHYGRDSTLPRRLQGPSVLQHRRRFIERLGFYNPSAKGAEEELRIAQDRLTYWKGVGAQPSPTVDRLIKQAAKKAA